jgi:hypothetical protein
MALFVIERSFAERLELTREEVARVQEINGDEQVRWLYSFLSADKKRTYCLYEAEDPEAIRAAARRAGIPADEVVEVTQFRPERIT